MGEAGSNPPSPRLADGALWLGDERVPLYCGAIHYFRVDPADWAGALSGVRDLGLRIVDVYVPWAVHEMPNGQFDFGHHDARLDLARFLGLAQDTGLLVYLRPGPHINAELTHFGIPRRIVLDPDCQARSAAGHPVPMVAPPHSFAAPSYGSRAFARATAAWYAAVAEVARPRLWPAGPIALLQVDNEASYYFRDGPYDQDYHPDSVARYRDFLRETYTNLEAVNDAYGMRVSHFDDLDPPRRFEGGDRAALRRQLDWAESREDLLVYALRRMRASLSDAGLSNLPTLHNLPVGDGGATAGIGRLQQAVDLVGLDFYECRHQLSLVRTRALRLVGSTALPFAPELGIGGPPWLPPRDRADTLAVLLCCLAYGVRGFNFYMAVDRDRWYGAALSTSGVRTKVGRRLRELMRSLERVGFDQLRRRADVGLMVPTEYARLGRATHTLGFMSPLVLAMMGVGPTAACRQDRLGFERPVQIDFAAWLAAAEMALDAAGVPYVYVDSAAPASVWSQRKVIFAPTYEFADPERLRALSEFERTGGQVVWGPYVPSLDQRLQHRDAPIMATAPVDLSGETDAAARVVAALPGGLRQGRDFATELPDVQTTLHEDDEGVRVVFAVNMASEHRRPALLLPPGQVTLTDAISGESRTAEGQLPLALPPYECRMLIVERPRSVSIRPSARRQS